jgi:hypothetical protein
MRRFQIAILFALAFGLACGVVLSAATITHNQNAAHRRTYTFQPATYHGHPAGHSRASAGTTSTGPKTVPAHAPRFAKKAVTAHDVRSRHHRIPLVTESASARATIPTVPLENMHLAPLVGSRESLVRQNERTEADGLERIQDDAQLNALQREKALIPVPVSASLHINEELPMNRRYCRPWTAKFLGDLARAHYARYHRYLQVTSAVRTVEYQRRLIEVNGNAAPAEGDIASPHLSGAAVDIAKKGLSISEIAWMRGYLYPLQMAGKLDVEEEFYQSCFHITVYRSYALPATPKAPVRHAPATLLASRMR